VGDTGIEPLTSSAPLCANTGLLPAVVGCAAVGPGSDLSEEPAVGIGPDALDCRVAPRVSSRARPFRIPQQLPEHHIGQPPLQTAQRLPVTPPRRPLPLVVLAASVLMPDLGDRHDVQRVVQPPIPGPRQPMPHHITRPHRDGAVPELGPWSRTQCPAPGAKLTRRSRSHQPRDSKAPRLAAPRCRRHGDDTRSGAPPG
jgi:hypothetical protein